MDGKVQPRIEARTLNRDTQGAGSKVSRPGDVVLTTKGTVGRVALMPPDGPAFAYSPQLCYFRPAANGPLRSRFLYYWFKSAEFWNQANALKSQTDMADFLSLGDLQRMQIGIPPLSRQDAIIDLLGAVDDKIAVNDRIAATANQYCAALFEDIVASNAKGTAELRDVALINTRTVKPTANGSLRYVDISSVGDGTLTWPERTSWNDAPSRARRGISVGDTLWSTVRPNRRSHTLVLDEDPLLVASTGFAVLTPRGVGPAFLYESARRDEFVAYLESVAEGSAYPAVRAEKFLAAPIIDVIDEHRDRFEALAWSARLRTHSATQEIRVLAEIRGTLLPELMSGRLRVKDAEKVVEEAV
ncbi:hypothetical protein BSA16_01085 [Micromonospora sp. Rc5]|nr:hypothetical protein BSA16_01085 [Micromonospora sp. Rc5]